MTTSTIHNLTAEEFNDTHNTLADSIYAHYAHTAISTANMAHVYNYLLAANINPMHAVEQHPDTLAEAERAYNL